MHTFLIDNFMNALGPVEGIVDTEGKINSLQKNAFQIPSTSPLLSCVDSFCVYHIYAGANLQRNKRDVYMDILLYA
jgi:hypothetical protein